MSSSAWPNHLVLHLNEWFVKTRHKLPWKSGITGSTE
jgi:hypothetical protein